MRCVFALAALTGCGRVQFTATDAVPGPGEIDSSTPITCTPVGHDEDADLIDDACDVCPAEPDPAQMDTDGDRVGNLCDPEPDVARQQLVMFDPFTSLDTTRWSFDSDERVENGELVLDAIGTAREIYRSYSLAQDWFIIGATTGAAGTSGDYMLALNTAPNLSGTGFYCEMYDNGQTRTMFTYTTDGTTFVHDGVALWPVRLENGGGQFEYLLTATTARCRSAWRGDVQFVEGTQPAIVPERFTIYAENVSVRVQYFLQIRTLP